MSAPPNVSLGGTFPGPPTTCRGTIWQVAAAVTAADEVLMKRRRERGEALRGISRLCRADPGTQPHFYPKTPPVKNQPTPPPKRRRVVVQGQQLKRLENRAQRDECRLTVKSQLIAIVAAVLLVGCGRSVDIWEAAEYGNIETIKHHLANGTDVNVQDF